MKEFNQKQIRCLLDGVSSITLSRIDAWKDFAGKESHDSRTAYSLIKHGCFIEKTFSQYGYPLSIEVDKENFIVKHLHLLNKEVVFQPKKNNPHTFTTRVLGFAVKNNELYFKWTTGSNYFTPVSHITDFLT